MREFDATGLPRMMRVSASLAAVAVALATACSPGPERAVLGIALHESDHAAVTHAVDLINAAGGVNGVRLALEGLDWTLSGDSPAEVSLEWADRFAGNPELLAVIGHSDSASTLSAASVYARRGLPHVVTIATHPEITRLSGTSYRLCVDDERQAEILADYAVREMGARSVALFYVNDDYGRGLAEGVLGRLESLGSRASAVVAHRNFLEDDDRHMIRSVLERLRAEDPPDLFLLVQRMGAGIFTIESIRELGLQAPVLGSDNLALLMSHSRGRLLEHPVLAVTFFRPDSGAPSAEALDARVREMVGNSLDYGQALAFDAIHLLAEAMGEGGFSREGVARALAGFAARGRRFEGAGGGYSLDAGHNALREVFVLELRAGKARLVHRYPPGWSFSP